MDLKLELRLFLDNFVSLNTKRSYKTDLEDFLGFVKFDITNCDIESAVDYRDYLQKSGKSSKTINRRFSSVKSFYKWLIRKGVANSDPTVGIILPKATVEAPTEAFTDEEVSMMFNIVDRSNITGKTHFFIMKMLFNLGLRRSELINIRVGDIKTFRGVRFLTIKGKGEKLRDIPLTDQMYDLIQDYISNVSKFYKKTLKKDDYILPSFRNPGSVYKLIRKYAEKCRIDKRVGAHSCRATIISKMLEEKESPRNVADFAGHASINTTINSYDKKRDGLKNSPVHKVSF